MLGAEGLGEGTYFKFSDNVSIQVSVKQPFWLASKENNTDRITNTYMLPGTYDPSYITDSFKLMSTLHFLKAWK